VLAAIHVASRFVDDAAAMPEADLAARLARGDAEALGQAYDAYHVHVRAFARRLLGDDVAAEDLVQETFVSLPGAAKGYRGDAPLRSFVVGVAANHVRHHIRSAARRRAAMDRVATDPPSSPRGPESSATKRELAAALTCALDGLPNEQRIAIVLCEVEERTAGEVAAMIGVPEATVRTRVFHGKRKLREALARGGLR
jgi:RNA polymerase sigma-70 factor (ECF subfamily)